jgi:GNAT superfamily N-acetyltransferase
VYKYTPSPATTTKAKSRPPLFELTCGRIIVAAMRASTFIHYGFLLHQVSAFSINPQERHTWSHVGTGILSSSSSSSLYSQEAEDGNTLPAQWTHDDIEWVLSPPPDTPFFEKVKLKAAASAIRAELLLMDQPVPPILCPKGGQAELEGFKDGKQIAKFGFTTSRGPSAPPIDETIEDLYGVSSSIFGKGIGAIIYMFVEPEYRGLGIGSLALEAIAAVQTVQNCDYTVLVADDDGTGKLIKWYEDSGYEQAPKLQDSFGSPDGKFGLTMIRPTSVRSDIFARCQIKWW